MDDVDLKKPYDWTSDIVFPDRINDEINTVLKVAATAHGAGIDMRQIFVGLTADNKGIFMDCSEVPPPVLPSWIMQQADIHKCVALVHCCEGYTLPSHLTEQYMKNRRPGDEIKDHPQAEEILLVTVETQKGHWAGRAVIKGEHPKRYLETNIHIAKSDQSGVRLSNLLRCNWEKDMPGVLKKAVESMEYLSKHKQEASSGKSYNSPD